MKKRSSATSSRTTQTKAAPVRRKRVKPGREHPEADVRHIVRGVVRRGLEPVVAKASVSLRLDADVLAWFKAQGPGYQTRINAVLRAFKEVSQQARPAGSTRR
jgi:uncharacterized protein (DUF4415 family)